MTMQQRPETPAEYDRRKVAPLEFAPHCLLDDCELRVSQAARCISCRFPLWLLCGPHAGSVPKIRTIVRCAECGTIAHANSLLQVFPLSGWV